ncbi:MAG: homoprotocatechuate degradation operon regulator HpaR [Burkholderiaceae bacterium]
MALLRAREAVMAKFRPMLREHDLTEQQWRVLRALEASGKPLRVIEIGQQTCLSMPSLSRLLKTLETRRLIRRAVHADDLRAAQVTLSPKGKALIEKIAPISEGHYDAITDAIGDTDVEQLYALLDRVHEKLGSADDLATGADRGLTDRSA